ncbi:hypothetical protein WJX73_008793 [Symbiochloris irregularis]|uniref:RING-type domain-containing protein n=1 Tax=Symbiochloris irregularis TaxID=706552 RepID=A0AAW1PIF0_9CHLO
MVLQATPNLEQLTGVALVLASGYALYVVQRYATITLQPQAHELAVNTSEDSMLAYCSRSIKAAYTWVAACIQRQPPVMVDCSICLCQHSEAAMYTIKPCSHRICKDSARTIITAAIQSCTFPILCPVCAAESAPGSTPSCPECIAKQAAVNAGRGLQACPIKDCPGAGVMDADVSCRAQTALTSSEGAEQLFCEYLKQRRHINCPQCGIKIQKTRKNEDGLIIEGCNHMRCPVCRSHVCWLCGELMPAHDPYSHYKQKGKCKGRAYS